MQHMSARGFGAAMAMGDERECECTAECTAEVSVQQTWAMSIPLERQLVAKANRTHRSIQLYLDLYLDRWPKCISNHSSPPLRATHMYTGVHRALARPHSSTSHFCGLTCIQTNWSLTLANSTNHFAQAPGCEIFGASP